MVLPCELCAFHLLVLVHAAMVSVVAARVALVGVGGGGGDIWSYHHILIQSIGICIFIVLGPNSEHTHNISPYRDKSACIPPLKPALHLPLIQSQCQWVHAAADISVPSPKTQL